MTDLPIDVLLALALLFVCGAFLLGSLAYVLLRLPEPEDWIDHSEEQRHGHHHGN